MVAPKRHLLSGTLKSTNDLSQGVAVSFAAAAVLSIPSGMHVQQLLLAVAQQAVQHCH